MFFTKEVLLQSNESCDIAIKAFEKEARGYDLAKYYSDSLKENPYYTRIKIAESLKEFINCGHQWVFYSDGLGYVAITKPDGKRIIYNLSTRRWRVEGKNVWYYSKNPTDFLKKYCN